MANEVEMLRITQGKKRRGVVTLEVILAIPIFVIALMPIVQFGLLFANQQYVAEATRAGTQVASELTTIGGVVPAQVQTAVARELSRIGVSNFTIRLEHNIDFSVSPAVIGPTVVLQSVTGSGPSPIIAPPAVVVTRRYVRVSVYVRSTELTPNLLSTYGFDLSTRASQETTLRTYTL